MFTMNEDDKLMILDKGLETEDQPAGFITEVKDMNKSTIVENGTSVLLGHL